MLLFAMSPSKYGSFNLILAHLFQFFVVSWFFHVFFSIFAIYLYNMLLLFIADKVKIDV